MPDELAEVPSDLLPDGLAPECLRLSMEEYFNKYSEACVPCTLGPVGNWYHSELVELGAADLAKEVEDATQAGDSMQFARALDQVKAKAEGKLRLRLQEFDCAIQLLTLDELAPATHK